MSFQLKYILVLFVFIFFSSSVFADFGDWKNKVDSEILNRIENGEQTGFIIQLKSQANIKKAVGYQTKIEKAKFVYNQLKIVARNSQKDVIQALEEEHHFFRAYWIVNVIYTKGDLALVEKIARLQSVARITHNQRLVVQETQTETINLRGGENVEWGISSIRADKVWELGYDGKGIIVAGQDTGVEWHHDAIQSNYRGYVDSLNVNHDYNWHDAIHEISGGDTTAINPCGLDTDIPCDDHNHGTHTIGTMVGQEDDLGSKIGVAPGAKWIACRNMERGNGTPITYIECFEWLMAPTDSNDENPNLEMAPHVINNSWGCPNSEGCDTTNYAIMEKVVDNIKASGIVVVVSAGNSGGRGCGSVSAPASIYENSFTVGAVVETDEITGFSSKGPVIVDGSNRMKPNISAPGVNVKSCVRGGQYASWAGTSMAGPHVAGVVALMIDANPSLAGQVDVIEDIIESTARSHTYDQICGQDSLTSVPNNAYGFGVIDALDAVNKALEFTTDIDDVKSPTEVSITPNPIEDMAILNTKGILGTSRLTIINVDGKIIKTDILEITENRSTQLLDFSNFPSGIYFYKLENGDLIFNGKLILI